MGMLRGSDRLILACVNWGPDSLAVIRGQESKAARCEPVNAVRLCRHLLVAAPLATRAAPAGVEPAGAAFQPGDLFGQDEAKAARRIARHAFREDEAAPGNVCELVHAQFDRAARGPQFLLALDRRAGP